MQRALRPATGVTSGPAPPSRSSVMATPAAPGSSIALNPVATPRRPAPKPHRGMTKGGYDFQHIASPAQVLYFTNTPKHYTSTTAERTTP